MAVVKGVNAGFVTTAPTANPNGDFSTTADISQANKDTTSSDVTKIIEIGWWQSLNSRTVVNFEVAIYDHDAGNDRPGNIIGVSRTNSMNVNSGWNKVIVDIDVNGSTIYWIGLQVDEGFEEAIITYTNTGDRRVANFSSTTLPDPWGVPDSIATTYRALYALTEVVTTGVTRKIKISGTFQDKPIKTKVGGTFVDKPIKIKVGGTFQDA